MARTSRAQPSTDTVAVPSMRLLPKAAGRPIQRAASTRRKWPCDTTSARSVASLSTRSITRSARAPTASGVSPPGDACVHTDQPGTDSRMVSVVRPS